MPEPLNQGLVFAVDLGGTYLRNALIDSSGKIPQQSKHPTPRGDSPYGVVNAHDTEARNWTNNGGPLIVAASIMVPGTVDNQNARVVQAPNLHSLSNFQIGRAHV